MGRKVARESTMKLLYQMDINDDFSQKETNIFLENNELKSDEIDYINEVIKGINNNIEEIDSYVEKYSEGWKLKRLAKIDLAILRIAIFEIMNLEDIPPQVSINEAVDVSKKYSTDESSKYINGLLGTFLKEYTKNKSQDN